MVAMYSKKRMPVIAVCVLALAAFLGGSMVSGQGEQQNTEAKQQVLDPGSPDRTKSLLGQNFDPSSQQSQIRQEFKPSGKRETGASSAAAAAIASNAAAESSAEENNDETMFYAFLKEDPELSGGPLYKYLEKRPLLRKWFIPQSRAERRFRPMMQWRRWADKHQRFFPALLFIGFVCVLSWALMPALLQAAAQECKTSFWKSFGTGMLVSIIAVMLLRAIFLSEIGWPLGILLAGMVQAGAVLGLSVSIYNLGHALALLLRIEKIPGLSNKPARLRFCELLVGSTFAALLLQIPALGLLPRCGSRLLAMFAILGLGAIYRELKRRKTAA